MTDYKIIFDIILHWKRAIYSFLYTSFIWVTDVHEL